MKKRLWKRKFYASYTVEATYIMAIVLFALSALIQKGFNKYREETGIMRLHHMVEQARGWEEDDHRKLDLGGWSVEVKRTKNQIEGSLKAQRWQKRIEKKAHEPENMMRMATIFQTE